MLPLRLPTSMARLGSVILATTSLLSLSLDAASAAPLADGHLECGRDILIVPEYGETPRGGFEVAVPVQGKRVANIVLNVGPGLAARPAALAAWNSAVDIWEAVLDDNVTIVIDADFASLAPGVLGATSPRSFANGYDFIRDQLVADGAADETILNSLPTAAQFSVTLPTGFSYTGNLVAPKATFKAMGFDMSFDDANADATMTFSTGFESSFDYDPSNGISAGQFDFEAIVVHELGHALGFVSSVDGVDFNRNQGTPGPVNPSVLDLFRLVPGAGATDFTNSPRLLNSGDLSPVQAWYEGNQDFLMSTGGFLGDGRQASHWKADELTGTFIGIMDPTLSPGQREELQSNDLRAFGLIGWDIASAPITDCNENLVDDALDISSGTSEDCNSNGVPDECDISSGASQDTNGNGVPNECEPTAVDTPGVSRYDVAASPNPFNPRSVIHFDMLRAGEMSLAVYDVTGRRVAVLADGARAQGRHQVIWTGEASDGSRVASGVYYVVFRAGDHDQRMKITLLK